MDTSEFQSKLDKVHSCLDQKVVLLTKMLNLTKQIEVQTRNEDIFLDDLSVDELSQKLQTTVTPIANSGEDLLNAILGCE